MTIHSYGNDAIYHPQKYNMNFDANTQPMWIYDQETLQILDVNVAALSAYGYSRQEFLSLQLPTLYTHEDKKRLNNSPELRRHLTRNGQTLDVQIHSHVVELARRRAVIVMAEHGQSGNQQTQSTGPQNHGDWFSALFRNAPEAIIICDQSGYIVMANQKMEEIFGYTSTELDHFPLGNLMPERFRESHHHHFHGYAVNAYNRSMGIGMELYGLSKNGREFPIEVGLSSMVVLDQQYMMATITDITRRKQMESRVMLSELMQVELEKERELIDLKERFVSMVTHEFRTPLATILSSAGLLDTYRSQMSEEQQDRHLKRIVDQVRIMNDLLEDVLTISRARAGIIELETRRLNLKDLCYEIIEEIRGIDQDRHHIRFVGDPIDDVEMDSRVIRHILSNLISNALKYSESDRDVEVELREKDDKHVVITVQDYGIGIPLDDMEHLFEPFHRAHNARHIAGTGLGLPIVKHNVEMHGGTIMCSSKEGEGTLFTVVLPKHQ